MMSRNILHASLIGPGRTGVCGPQAGAAGRSGQLRPPGVPPAASLPALTSPRIYPAGKSSRPAIIGKENVLILKLNHGSGSGTQPGARDPENKKAGSLAAGSPLAPPQPGSHGSDRRRYETNRAGNSAGRLDPRVGNGWIWSAGVPGRPGGRRAGLQAATNGTPKSFSRPPPSRR